MNFCILCFYYTMSDNIQKVFKLSEINMEKIVYSQAIETNDNKYIVSKIWYKGNNIVPHTLNVQTPYLKLKNDNCQEHIIVFTPKHIATYIDNIDRVTIKFMEKNDFINKYNLKGFRYKTLISEVDNNDIFRISIVNNRHPILFYSSEVKCEISRDIVQSVLKNTEKIKIIFEVDGLIIDVKNHIMFTNVIARHVLIFGIRPVKVELTSYSFVDSDDEKNKQEYLQDNENDLVLNTQTEYNMNDTNVCIQHSDDKLCNTSVEHSATPGLGKQAIVNSEESMENDDMETENIKQDIPEEQIKPRAISLSSQKPKGKLAQKRVYIRKVKKIE